MWGNHTFSNLFKKILRKDNISKTIDCKYFTQSIEKIFWIDPRGGSRTAATSKMERFVIIVNGWNALTIITKRSILDVAAVLDRPLDPLTTNNVIYRDSLTLSFRYYVTYFA